jgi:carbamate kinase
VNVDHMLDIALSVAEMEDYVSAGHFKAGSMGPKVEACLRAGGTGIIASLTEAIEAVEGTAGTRIVGERVAASVTE